MTSNYSEEQIQKILLNYKKKRDRENKYYQEVTKHNEDFKAKNRERAKSHYDRVGKDMKKDGYEKNKDIRKAKSLYNYYKKNDKIDMFIEKHKEKHDLIFGSTD
tara:strand:+ start:56 stop:367 length:312 start_codon:yes stop_codon:yes gene_type:complete